MSREATADVSLSAPTVIGMTVTDSLPVGVQHVPVSAGVTAMYGKNGVGKSRLLRAIFRLLNDASPYDYQDERKYRSPAAAFYGLGGVHLHLPVDRTAIKQMQQRSSDTLIDLIGSWLSDPWTQNEYRHTEDYTAPPEITETYPSHLSRMGVTESELDWLLAHGRWFWQPQTRALFLCDPSPLDGSPLVDRWQSAADLWARGLDRLTSHQKSYKPSQWDFGRLKHRAPGPPIDPFEPAISPRWDFINALEKVGERESRISWVPLLMPLPDFVSYRPAPEWVAYPVVRVAGLFNFIARSGSDGLDGMASDPSGSWLSRQLTDRALNRVWPVIASIPHSTKKFQKLDDSDAFKSFFAAVDEVVAATNEILAELFETPPKLGRIDASIRSWFNSHPPTSWRAITPDGNWFGVDHLGAAHKRYVAFAFERAVNRWVFSQRRSKERTAVESRSSLFLGSFLLVDEPERALHPLAERRVAERLSTIADFVIAATHSLDILDTTSRQSGPVCLIEQHDNSKMSVSEQQPDVRPDQRGSSAHLWGTTPSRIASLVRTLLFVEGPHDREVIGHFLTDTLRRTLTDIHLLGGSKDVHKLAETGVIFNSTDAPLLVCLDNGSYKTVRAWSRAMERSGTQADRITYLDHQRPSVKNSPEMTAALELLRLATSLGREDRMHLFPLSKRDIVEYLPVSLIHPGFDSWTALNDAFLESVGRTHFVPGDGLEKKRWIKQSGGSLNIKSIRQALQTFDAQGLKRHGDFDRLAMEIFKLSLAEPEPSPLNPGSH